MRNWSDIVGSLTIAAALPFILSVTGCSDSTGNIDSGAGYIVPYVTVMPEVITAVEGPQQTIVTEVPDADMLSLRITDQNQSYSHTWTPITTYSSAEPLRPGKYLVETFYGDENIEGFDTPYFYGSSTVEVVHNQTTETSIECQLANTMIEVHYTDAFRHYFKSYSVTLHSFGGTYVNFSADETRAAYLKAGDISIGLDLTLRDGRNIAFSPTSIPKALPRYYYNLTFGIEQKEGTTPKLIVSFDEKTASDDVTIDLTEEFINAKSPALTPIGFVSDTNMNIGEGNLPAQPLQVAVSALGAPLADLTMTTLSQSLLEDGWPSQINLLEMDAETSALIKSLGMKITDINTLRTVGGVIDLTEVIPNLRYDKNLQKNIFIFEARDKNTRISSPVTLKVTTEPVDFTVISSSDAIIGINEAEAIIEAPSASIERNLTMEVLNAETGEWETTDITNITDMGSNRYAVRFKVPEGTGEIHWRVLYCGSVRHEAEIKRVAPAYTVEWDAFAMKLALRVTAQNDRLTPIVASHLRIYDGDTSMPVIERDPEKGIVYVGGLQPSSKYRLRTTLSDHPSADDFSEPFTVETEPMTAVPNGSFEDISLTIDYKDMLSGGRYSQDYVEIFNLQNRTTFALSTPKGWATTNPKTFCTDATNHNTWYLEPSVTITNDASDQAYGVKLTSVAWDIEGPEIPDYLQESVPFVKYSRNIPRIAHRAAGKLFLGTYIFDPMTMTEYYNEGIDIKSRPSALNGYYAYTPGEDSQSDRGYVRVEVLGIVNSGEVTLARGTALLVPAQSFTAFNVPLTYDRFGVKATRIKVFFSSTFNIGSIAQETEQISTTPSPVTSTSTGSSLWLDNLSFSY